MPGEFLDPVGSIQVFEQVVDRVMRMPEHDPKVAFRTATPGVIGLLTEQMGPWRGRESLRFEIPGVTQGARAIGPEERMRVGTDDIGHIVALRGFELAGHTQRVTPEMFGFNGMTAERARDLAAKPILDFNDEVAHIMLNVMTSGDYSGSLTNAFAWSATDLAGNTASQDLITDTVNQVENVYPYDGQTFTKWPLRDGTRADAGHDHLLDTGAAWSAANAKIQANTILEHPGNGRVVAYVGSTVATAVQAALKSDFGSTALIQRFVQNAFDMKGDEFGFATPIGPYDGIDYVHMVDLPADGVLMVAGGKRPFHAHIGAVGGDGAQIGTGGWTEAGDAERRGTSYGYRQYFSAGVKDPLAAAYHVHNE